MPPETFSRLRFGIGIFHSFAHVYACQVLYSPRRLLGVGLSDGESCERFWSSIRHFIPSLRPAHASTRRQILMYAAIEQARARTLGLPKAFLTSFRSTLKTLKQCDKDLKAYYKEFNMTTEELQKQLIAMEQYFANSSSACMDDEDDLCQVIRGIDMIKEWTEKNASLKTGEVSTGYLTMRMRLSLLSGYRIDIITHAMTVISIKCCVIVSR
jgi:hypothetical protein